MPSLERVVQQYGARVTVRRAGDPAPDGRCIVYWMQRAQRALDNPALNLAVDLANELKLPCVVFFAPVPYYPHANLRHYRFLQQAIADTAARCEKRSIGFVLRRYPDHGLIKFCDEVKAALVVGDENPLREPRAWREKAAKKLRVPLFTVDADVIIPTRLFQKEQYAARIIRPRIHACLEEYLTTSDDPRARIAWEPPRGLKSLDPTFDITEDWADLDRSVAPVNSFVGGTGQALVLLRDFVDHKLLHYPDRHAQADIDGTSRLSPYLHFGHIGPITVALAVKNAKGTAAAKDDFLDQLITWRELSACFVHYNEVYDSLECAEPWAHKTLAAHTKDKRPVLYTRTQLERAETDDELWNAAQKQMLHAGWMHNYMRMYWAKKILEWSPSPASAYNTAVYLNDKYFLDGRDPNGYAGIAWAIAGKFDRPWFERPIFGLIRYMAESGARKKFDTKRYIAQMNALAGQGQPELF
ncbi:MAG TPA: deoxyribodipyrimidine photo-lyase [Terriglobales bacterium]|nr:deoxyribodipyrimidine photo-lyase [Terriglobales bacterium]